MLQLNYLIDRCDTFVRYHALFASKLQFDSFSKEAKDWRADGGVYIMTTNRYHGNESRSESLHKVRSFDIGCTMMARLSWCPTHRMYWAQWNCSTAAVIWYDGCSCLSNGTTAQFVFILNMLYLLATCLVMLGVIPSWICMALHQPRSIFPCQSRLIGTF